MTFNYYRYSSYIGDDSTVNSNSSRIIDLDTSRYYFATPPSSGLYAFTSFTFTNAGITGRTGPTRANCLSSYNTTTYPWLNNTAYFNVVTQGYQEWTVPETATYRITAIGAKGGTGTSGTGAGAYMQATFSLTKSQVYIFIVGQQGNAASNPCTPYQSGGGGGGSYFGSIALGFLLVAGGGGGGSYTASGGDHNATTTQNANNGAAGGAPGGLGGTGGNGGGVYTTGCVVGGGGGAGIITNGASAAGTTNGGNSYSAGFIGGLGQLADGGFGGGGGTSQYMGGGGGGYSGGGGGGIATCSCTSLGAGGGGASYINTSYGTLITSTAIYNTTTHGSILVEKL